MAGHTTLVIMVQRDPVIASSTASSSIIRYDSAAPTTNITVRNTLCIDLLSISKSTISGISAKSDRIGAVWK